MNCPLCDSGRINAFGGIVRVMERHKAQYHRCGVCDLVFAEDPYWLKEAYENPISATDLGYCGRNVSLVRMTHAVLWGVLGRRTARGLDYGGGYGMFVRLMRDRGWDFFLYEPHAANLFAGRYVVSDLSSNSIFDVVTAFEVIEHTVHPLEMMKEWLRLGRVLILSSQLVPPEAKDPREWWYFGLQHGQHVSLMSAETLLWLGKELSCGVHSADAFHLFTRLDDTTRCLGSRFRFFTSRWGQVCAGLLYRGRSLLPSDYRQVTGLSLR